MPQTTEKGEVFREEIRQNHYYGGEVFVVVDEDTIGPGPDLFVEWVAYQGGSAKLKLDWDEAKRLMKALSRAEEHKPEWWDR